MLKVIKLLLFLFLCMIGVQLLFAYFSKRYEITYQVLGDQKNFIVKETYTAHNSKTGDYYRFVIDDEFSFKIFDNLGKDSRIIKEIKYYEDSTYKCIYPIFKNKKVKMDVLCKDNNLIYYHSIEGENKNLDEFVQTLEGYDSLDYKNKESKKVQNTFVTVYKDHLVDHHYLILQTYKGFYNVNNRDNHIIDVLNYYEHDIYEPKIFALTGKYLVSANYNQNLEFNQFFITDVITNIKKTIFAPNMISYQSYIQGVVNDCVYIVDKKNQKQYEINPKDERIREIGNVNSKFQYYENGKWSLVEASETISSDKKFINRAEYQHDGYDYTYKTSQFYYLFKKRNNRIEVSRTDIEDQKNITYLFSVEKMNDISYVKDYIYFENDGKIQYYSDKTGLKTLAEHSEMKFNQNLKYFIYVK